MSQETMEPPMLNNTETPSEKPSREDDYSISNSELTRDELINRKRKMNRQAEILENADTPEKIREEIGRLEKILADLDESISFHKVEQGKPLVKKAIDVIDHAFTGNLDTSKASKAEFLEGLEIDHEIQQETLGLLREKLDKMENV